MLELNSVTFKDNETGKVIEVFLDGTVKAKEKMTSDEYVLCSFHASLLIAGGIDKVKEFMKK